MELLQVKSGALCPITIPQAGGSCSGSPSECGYDKVVCTDAFEFVGTVAKCVDGIWTVVSSETKCPAECPLKKPEPNAECSYEALACEYDTTTCADGSKIVASFAECGGGKWRLIEASATCQAVCPAEMPTLGSSCTGSDMCEYGRQECSDGTVLPTSWAQCDEGIWATVQQQECRAGCPSDVPEENSACTMTEGKTCQYEKSKCPNGIEVASVHASCGAGKWVVSKAAALCPGECPATRPEAASACIPPITAGKMCEYDPVECPGGEQMFTAWAICSGNEWMVAMATAMCA